MTIETRYIHLDVEQTLTEEALNEAGVETQSISFDARIGKWSLFDAVTGKTGGYQNESFAIFALFEHDEYGDLTDWVLGYFDWFSGDNNWKEIEGTYDDILTALYDNNLIDGVDYLYHTHNRNW